MRISLTLSDRFPLLYLTQRARSQLFAYGHPLVTGHENTCSSYGTGTPLPLGERSRTNLHGWYSSGSKGLWDFLY